MQEYVNSLGFNEIETGQVFETSHEFSAQDVLAFARLSGDFSPLHVDAEYAGGTEFGGQVVHGMLLASLFSRLVGMQIPGEPALYLGQDLAFRRPVGIGEPLRATSKVTSKNALNRTIVLATEIRNSQDQIVVSGTAKVKVRESVADNISEPEEVVKTPQGKSKQRVFLVTGASRGIGAAIARMLGQRKHSVVVNYFSSESQALSVVNDIKAAGGDAIAVRADVRDRNEVTTMIDQTFNRFGRLDGVVNGAVGELHAKPFVELGWDSFEAHLTYQLKAATNVCQIAYPYLKASDTAGVVNLLSQVTSGTPPVHMADYVAAKYALMGLSRALAIEWSSDNIRVNTVSPALIQTELTQHYQERIFKMETARTPLKRLAVPNDIAETVAFLLSDAASFITGTDISLSGGQVMK